jgi:MerR family transcriptional regulator, copper efflux regulator
MLIGELSKETGVSKDTIRFYEKLGLITGSDRQAGTKIYKEYGSEALERLSMIDRGKGLGFTLSEIKQLIEWGGIAMSTPDKIKAIEHKVEEIIEKQQKLDRIKTDLLKILNNLNQELSPDKQCDKHTKSPTSTRSRGS